MTVCNLFVRIKVMIILTEKPSVAKDFAKALSCNFVDGVYKNLTTVITNCIGHLFKEEPPAHYSSTYPVIPTHWDYCLPEDNNLAKHAKFVTAQLKAHANDIIVIATDADREGEIIARECLQQAGIKDFSKIKRFWVSQALTPDVIQEGLRQAKPLSDYNRLAEQGFARQHADWLVGMNFCSYISNAARTKLTVGRVQTAILSAIEQRCNAIKNFQSEKYYEYYGYFNTENSNSKIRGIYFEPENNTAFKDTQRTEKLKICVGQPVKLTDSKVEKKITNPPQLYNLNAVQKEAFKFYGFSAEVTLHIIQSLYEELKCVSYPRTPSRVMGSGNVELCQKVADELTGKYNLQKLRTQMNISLSNKRCFNDSKLEAHHALIPLKALPESATTEQRNVYNLILVRFFMAFLPEEQYEKQTFICEVCGNKFRITGKKIIESGWKADELNSAFSELNLKKTQSQTDKDSEEEIQTLDNINWSALILSDIEMKEKWTKPPAYFNEASILTFMENPKAEKTSEDSTKKLIGLGTAATRHTFIPLLMRRGYITLDKKNFMCTNLGSVLLKAVRNSTIEPLADISTTTDWEERLDQDPIQYLEDIKSFVRDAVAHEVQISLPATSSGIACPICGKEVRKGKKNWYCTGYKEGCKFTIWETVAGTKLSDKDISSLCSGKKTGIKHCSSKTGKTFDCYFILDSDKNIKFEFKKN